MIDYEIENLNFKHHSTVDEISIPPKGLSRITNQPQKITDTKENHFKKS